MMSIMHWNSQYIEDSYLCIFNSFTARALVTFIIRSGVNPGGEGVYWSNEGLRATNACKSDDEAKERGSSLYILSLALKGLRSTVQLSSNKLSLINWGPVHSQP